MGQRDREREIVTKNKIRKAEGKNRLTKGKGKISIWEKIEHQK